MIKKEAGALRKIARQNVFHFGGRRLRNREGVPYKAER
jgi:hypothetical protein